MDSGAIVGALITVAASVLVGGLTMAYFLGRLAQQVKDLRDDVKEGRQWEDNHDQLHNHIGHRWWRR